jgi:uncharacterized SAM-binding protein YcdF (DUF218 family)
MFFVVSKLLTFFLNPLLWLLFGLWRLATSVEPRARRRIKRTLFWGLLIFSNPLVLNGIFTLLETPRVTLSGSDSFDVAIVLGGYTKSDISDFDQLQFNLSGNRLFESLRLFHSGKARRLLLSGGSGEFAMREIPEADLVAAYLRDIHIPDSLILVENQSRTTFENAQYSKRLLDSLNLTGSRLLLVTSASHMPRARACYEKAGLRVTAYPVDHFSQKVTAKPQDWIVPELKGPYLLYILLKERVGYVVYRLKGHI